MDDKKMTETEYRRRAAMIIRDGLDHTLGAQMEALMGLNYEAYGTHLEANLKVGDVLPDLTRDARPDKIAVIVTEDEQVMQYDAHKHRFYGVDTGGMRVALTWPEVVGSLIIYVPGMPTVPPTEDGDES